MEKKGDSEEDSGKLEEVLQQFLNEITASFERHKVPVDKLDFYERKVMDAASLLQIIETILAMHKDLMAHIEAGSSYLPLSDRDDKYNNLEKVLQKYEQEIRNHIRVEQQLKIYTDSMQETLEEREKKIKQLTEQNITMTKHLEKKLEEAQQENTRLKSRLQTQNSAPRSKTEGLRESMESLKESKTNKIEIYSRKNKSIPRNPSRDITPLEKKQSNSSYIANLEKSLKGKKGMEKNLLINFKKIYNNSKKEKEYSINNYINFMRMKTVSHQPSALADTGGAKKLLRSQRSKDNRSTPHEIFHSRKTSQASKKN